MAVNGGPSTGVFFIYGWKGPRGVDGPYYVGGANTVGSADLSYGRDVAGGVTFHTIRHRRHPARRGSHPH